MSAEDIQAIIRRSVLDRAFAKALRQNFYHAVAEYNLSSIEMAALRAMQVEYEDRKKKRHSSKKSPHPKASKVNHYFRLD